MRGHRDVFLRFLYSVTDADDVTAAAKEFEKKIDKWIINILQFPQSVPGIYNTAIKATELMVNHRSRNLTCLDDNQNTFNQ